MHKSQRSVDELLPLPDALTPKKNSTHRRPLNKRVQSTLLLSVSGLSPSVFLHRLEGSDTERDSDHDGLLPLRKAGKHANSKFTSIDIRSPMLPHHSDDYFAIEPSQLLNRPFHLEHPPQATHTPPVASVTELDAPRTPLLHPSGSRNSFYLAIQPVKKRSRLGFKRLYYNDFTTIDWVNSFILKNRDEWELRKRGENSLRGKVFMLFNKFQSYILITLFSFCFALLAFLIDKFESFLVGFKNGYCVGNWTYSYETCCAPSHSPLPPNGFRAQNPHFSEQCSQWRSWSEVVDFGIFINIDWSVYIFLSITLALFSVLVSLTTKTATSPSRRNSIVAPTYLYTAVGSGVPEVKTILLGFVIRKFLGTYTLIAKTVALVFAIALGMSLGKEGPYVHLATCVGNILCRFFPAIHNNEYRKKLILTASCSAGVALAFGSPLGGVLFTLEEIDNYLPAKQLFKIFFCAVLSTIFLKFLNPYGTGKAVLFAVKYASEWKLAELVCFVVIGACGGIFGAAFVKFVRWWPTKFRTLRFIENRPVREVMLVALLTSLVTFGNPYTEKAIPELMLDLATSCTKENWNQSLCPTNMYDLVSELRRLSLAFVFKLVLTGITFGLKVPSGVYVPSMVIGALFGRVFALMLEYLNYNHPSLMVLFCEASGEDTGLITCVDSGIYSLIAAGAFMAGVTRMNITLVIILFELTSSYTYVIPISIAIAVSNWVATALEPLSLYESLLVKNNYPFIHHEGPFDPLVTVGDILMDEDTETVSIHTKKGADELSGASIKTGSEQTPLVAGSQAHYHSSGTVERLKGTDTVVPQRPGLHATPSAWLRHLVQSNLPQFNSYYHDMVINITEAASISSTELLYKFSILQRRGLIDGCIPIIKSGKCIGLIPGPELEMQLDRLREFCLEYGIVGEIYCSLTRHGQPKKGPIFDLTEDLRLVEFGDQSLTHSWLYNDAVLYQLQETLNHLVSEEEKHVILLIFSQLVDLSRIVDYNPIFINSDADLSLVELMFGQLGTRSLILLKDGDFFGVLHKKIFIDYCRRKLRH
ncbi:hypothetical protein BABINDRAFT_161251 [Babjeviella inositovora NRRL Y-12698]|uniref:Chloride channel protein n=1 Tax=Babjeviella inositovora NRRL Y-12698 TaxID=984486 RepID=A0A1E3QRG8_9ASCO|nr:uncharacterized protein BABINDRAFT_161251 [Babjeviella inositovora NRRL Y-12698]ODQ80289.1 hypothetical protein BABINDRAFT_161251 [Babjeviella inositovora NRRL Y-12698]